MVDADALILISVDDHIAEPPDMFERHVPSRYRDLAPRVVEDAEGRQQWWYGNVRGRNLGLNAVAGKPREMFGIDAARYDEMRPGCYDVHERVRDMNAGGQLAGLNFPNWTGFAGQVLSQGPDVHVNEVMVMAYNDWHVEEWCASYPDRFIPCGILPQWDLELAAREIRRLAKMGCHAVSFSENPEALGMPSIHSGAWEPVFRAAAEEETVLCCHLGSSSRRVPVSSDAPPSVNMTSSSAAAISTLVELIWAEFWERFPTLRLALTEGDVGWIPYFLWRAEHVQARHSGWTRREFRDGDGPTAVFKKHLITCFIADPIGVELLDHLNVDQLCWESDFPHSDGTWPEAPERLAACLSNVPDDVVQKVSHRNAMELFRFNPFNWRPREECTVGVLRAESPDVDVVTRVGRKPSERDLEMWKAMRAPA